MDNPSTSIDKDVFIGELKDCAQLLSEKLSSDDYEGAKELIDKLVEVRDRNMFNMVGRLTRGLHNAIVNFNVEGNFDVEPTEIVSSEIKDATDRMNYVINMTQKAAETTMDKVEESAPIALSLGEEASQIRDEWQRLQRREMSKGEFKSLYKRIDDFLEQTQTGSQSLNQNLQDIILEQGFQDLTGQVLKKVIGLVRDVEQNLVDLVRIAGQVEDITGLGEDADSNDLIVDKKVDELEGPQVKGEEREDVMSSQDEVDDLLSSLGF